jgi:predicted DNA repair protein MutK
MAASLLALLDDIASLLDDVALLSKVAAEKTAGVLGDDLALNAQQVTGIAAQRELPVVWAVCKGSLRNKLILVPGALVISVILPWAVLPLLMIGGAYLCFEGFEKLAHRVVHRPGAHAGSGETALRDPVMDPAHDHLRALADPGVDLVEFEQEKIRGAIRTDFILSAEIVTITLGTVQDSAWPTQLMVLSGVALLMTFGVYGAVAAIVKLDDLGLYLARGSGAGARADARRALGRMLVRAAPALMKALAVLGTAAMFLVGGAILAHGAAFLHHARLALEAHAAALGAIVLALAPLLFDLLTGVLTGALVYFAARLVLRARAVFSKP